MCLSSLHLRDTLAAMQRARRSPSEKCHLVRPCSIHHKKSRRHILVVDVFAFHAGTSTINGKTVTSGGRVLCVSAYAPTLQQALDAAYAGVENISFEGKVFRRDIAHRSASATFLLYAYPLTRSGKGHCRRNTRLRRA